MKKYISLKKYSQTYFLCKLYNNMKMLRNLLNFVKHDIDYCVVFVSLDVFLLSLWGGKYPLIFKGGHLPLIQSRRQRMDGNFFYKTFTIKKILIRHALIKVSACIQSILLEKKKKQPQNEFWNVRIELCNLKFSYSYKLIKIRLYGQQLTCVFYTLKEMLSYLYMSFST